MLMSAKGEQGLEVEKFSEVRFQTQRVTDVGAGAAFCLEYQLLRLWFTAELLAVNGSGSAGVPSSVLPCRGGTELDTGQWAGTLILWPHWGAAVRL